MKALITGAGGFVGGHLLHYLAASPDTILHGTLYSDTEKRPALLALCPNLWTLDLCNAEAVESLLATIRPDSIFHLAGQSYVPRSFEDPWETLENNIRGTLNILEAIRKLNLSTRILVVGSADIYGVVQPENLPINEDAPFFPSSPYSVSKVAQDMLALQYTLAHEVFTVRVRPFNHIGPGQNIRFSVPNWASQIAEAEQGQREGIVYVGDLSAQRDFTDVRDVVRAYAMSLATGDSGAAYNVCSGQAHSMQSILEMLIAASTVPIKIQVAEDRLRPVQIPVLRGDCSRLYHRTGWTPQIPIQQSLLDILNEWRQRITIQAT